MREQLAKELLNIISLTKTGIIKGINVSIEQGSHLVKEIILFNLAQRVFIVICGIIGLLIIAIVTKMLLKFYKENPKNEYGYKRDPAGIWITAICVSGTTFIPICVSIVGIIKIWLAPRLFLIEYLQNFVHK